MPQGVVNILETVQVDEHHAHALVVASGGTHALLQQFIKQCAIREPGQRIVVRHGFQLLPSLVQLGEIAHHAYRLLVLLQGSDARLKPRLGTAYSQLVLKGGNFIRLYGLRQSLHELRG